MQTGPGDIVAASLDTCHDRSMGMSTGSGFIPQVPAGGLATSKETAARTGPGEGVPHREVPPALMVRVLKGLSLRRGRV